MLPIFFVVFKAGPANFHNISKISFQTTSGEAQARQIWNRIVGLMKHLSEDSGQLVERSERFPDGGD